MKYIKIKSILILVLFIFIVGLPVFADIILPNDPLFLNLWDEDNPEGKNWGQEFIKLPSAWNITTGSKNIKIGIVDSGFDLTHEDLKGNIDFIGAGNWVHYHGSHVLGIIAAEGNNDKGITGVNWDTSAFVYSVGFYKNATDVLKNKITWHGALTKIRIKEAIDKGAKIINISGGLSLFDVVNLNDYIKSWSFLINQVNDQRNDVLFVFATGNEKKNFLMFAPANLSKIYDNAISVAAIDENGDLADEENWGSNYGDVTVAAPGNKILSTVPKGSDVDTEPCYEQQGVEDGYGCMSGTSMAAPFVSGLAGLIYSRAEELGKTLTAAEVKQLIIDGAVKGGKYAEGPDGVRIPIINAYESLKLLEPASCGDGIINGTEQCDGIELGGATCASVMGESFVGDLSCNSSCNYDTSLCRVEEPSSSVSWGAFGGNAARNGQSEYIGPQSNNIKWQNSEISNWQMPFFGIAPLVGKDNTVYLANQSQGKLFALNATTGTTEWSFPSNDSLGTALSLPAISSDGNIYIGSDLGTLYAINTDGTEKWHYTTNPLQRIGGAPVTDPDSGTIYFTTVYGSSKNTLYSLNPDGSLKWRFDVSKPSYLETASPAIASDGTVYMSFWEDGLYALNPDKSIKWQDNELTVSSPLVGSDGTIYVIIARASETGNLLLALNPDGTEKWTYSGVDRMIKPAVSSDGIIFAKGRHINGQYVVEFWAIKSNGALKWKNTEIGYAYFSTPAIGADGLVYIATTKGLYALDSLDGTIKWKKLGLCCSSPAIDSNGDLYYGTYDKGIYAFGE